MPRPDDGDDFSRRPSAPRSLSAPCSSSAPVSLGPPVEGDAKPCLDRAPKPDRASSPVRPERLRKRADFVAASKGRRQHQRCFSLQSRKRESENLEAVLSEAPRFGFTVTKKVGKSVIRNRIRRRLREAVRLMDPSLAKPGHDYVLVARIEALAAPFEDLRGELSRALNKIHQSGDTRRAASPPADRKQNR